MHMNSKSKMQQSGADKRTRARRKYSIGRVLVTGVGLFAAFGVLAVVMFYVLNRFLPSEQATMLAFSACIGAGVVIAMWATEGVIEMQTAHVHAHIRKAMGGGAAAGSKPADWTSHEAMRGM